MRPFTPSHRAGEGPPLVLLHGFMDTWRIWELTLPSLERRHEVLALTLPGHAGGSPIHAPVTHDLMADAVERAMHAAGFETAHVAGNSLGGYVALQLAARRRARTVTAFAPAGGWAEADADLFAFQRDLQHQAKAVAPHAEALLATESGRRRATQWITTNFEHIPAELLAHQVQGIAGCAAAPELIEHAGSHPWELDAPSIECPVRIVWGTADRLLPWPAAAARYRTEWLPHADWVELDGIGHCPPLDVPQEAAALILG